MQVTFYQVKEKENTANKIKNAVIVYEKDIKDFLGVSQSNITIKISKQLSCNYAKYNFNGINYYGYVKISCDNKGLYLYSITVDSLATAYYNNILHVNSNIIRSSQGNRRLKDDLISYENKMHKVKLCDFENDNNDYFFVVNTVPPKTNHDYINMPDGIESYCFTPNAYYLFLKNFLGEPDHEKAINSILSISIINKNEIPTNALQDYNFNYIYLSTLQDKLFEADIGYIKVFIDFGADSAFKIKSNNKVNTIHDKNLDSQFSLLDDGNDVNFSFDIFNYGVITFKSVDIIDDYISSIGYYEAIDVITGIVRIYLRVNGKNYQDIFIESNIKETRPVIFDNNLQNWVTNTANIGTQIATSTVGLATNNPTVLSSGLTGLGSAIASIAAQSEQAVGTMFGTRGGSIYRQNGLTTKLYASYRNNINRAYINQLFGYPSYTYGIIDSFSGFIQTFNCKLYGNIPYSIIQEAETQCDSGIYII